MSYRARSIRKKKNHTAAVGDVSKGVCIIHKSLGVGVIKSLDNDKCEIEFSNGVRKYFLLSSAVSSGFISLKK